VLVALFLIAASDGSCLELLRAPAPGHPDRSFVVTACRVTKEDESSGYVSAGLLNDPNYDPHEFDRQVIDLTFEIVVRGKTVWTGGGFDSESIDSADERSCVGVDLDVLGGPKRVHLSAAARPRVRACLLAVGPRLLAWNASGNAVAVRDTWGERRDRIVDIERGGEVLLVDRFVQFEGEGERTRIELRWPRGCTPSTFDELRIEPFPPSCGDVMHNERVPLTVVVDLGARALVGASPRHTGEVSPVRDPFSPR
jgi:hypothetical protein